MRIQEKEIIDMNEKINIIKKCKICKIGLLENNVPNVISLNYGYIYDNITLILFFYSALEGKKMEIIKNSDNAYFEINCDTKMIDMEEACNYGYTFKNIMGYGKIEILEDIEEKIVGLNMIMKHQTEKEDNYNFTNDELKNVYVYKMVVEHFSGKEKGFMQK